MGEFCNCRNCANQNEEVPDFMKRLGQRKCKKNLTWNNPYAGCKQFVPMEI